MVPGEGNPISLFASFSSMGHPWGPEWAQDPSQEPPGPLRTSISGEFWWIFIDFFYNFGWFPARLFHRFSMVELGWERVPYSTGWEGAVANLGGNMSRKTWVGRCVGDVFPPKFAVAPSYPTCGGRVPTQVCWHTFPPNFWKSKPRHGGGAGPQGSWISFEGVRL